MPLTPLVDHVVKNLVDSPCSVKVVSETSDGVTTYHVSVSEKEIGQVIGKQGRTAQALRVILKAASRREGLGAHLKINEHPVADEEA